jgi:hypothetical protein
MGQLDGLFGLIESAARSLVAAVVLRASGHLKRGPRDEGKGSRSAVTRGRQPFKYLIPPAESEPPNATCRMWGLSYICVICKTDG